MATYFDQSGDEKHALVHVVQLVPIGLGEFPGRVAAKLGPASH